MKNTLKKVLAVVLAVALVIGIMPNSKTASANEPDAENYVVMSLEGLNLGQGFYMLPQKMSYSEIAAEWEKAGITVDKTKLTAAQATYAFFSKAGIKTEPSAAAFNKDTFYLQVIKGIDKGSVNVPDVIKNSYKAQNGKDLVLSAKTGTDLGEMDYTSQSGWMVSVDNEFLNVGAGSYVLPTNEESKTFVIRWMFTLADYGADLGMDRFSPDWGADPYYERVDRNEAYKSFAENYEAIKDKANLNIVTDILSKPDATKAEINSVIDKINLLKENDGYANVTVAMNSTSRTMQLTDAKGNNVELPAPTSYKYSLKLLPGEYTVKGFASDGTTSNGTIKINVTDELTQTINVYTVSNINVNNSGWVENTDYKLDIDVVSSDNVKRDYTLGVTSASSSKPAVLCLYADTVTVNATPINDKAADYMPVSVVNTITFNKTSVPVTIPAKTALKINVPAGSKVEVGTLTNYYQYKTTECESNNGNSYNYTVANGTNYYYKVSNKDGVTYWNWFNIKEDTEITVTEADLYMNDTSKNKDTVLKDLNVNKFDVADIYMNVNEKGFITLSPGETFRLENFRNWQAIESISNAKVAEPDFHYEILDINGSDTITATPADNSAVCDIKANKEGTAVVLVTYDAVTNMAAESYSGSFFSAIWPENTGVFVVNVSDKEADLASMKINEGLNSANTKVSGDNLDAELDILYYDSKANGASYTFAAEENVKVSVMRPVIENDKLSYKGFSDDSVIYNSDNTITVNKLVTGSNIIKLEKGNDVSYQVIRAKAVDINYTYKNAAGEEITKSQLKPGCSIDIRYGKLNEKGASYDGIYIPANKLSGIYNMSGTLKLNADDKTAFSGKANQYLFANTTTSQTVTVKIPDDYADDTYHVTGYIYENGFGSPYGMHRILTHEKGKTAQFNAIQCAGYMGQLPEMYFDLNEEDMLDINVKIYDHTATAAGIAGASENGVILETKVKANTASQALTKAMRNNNISYDMSAGYISSINNLGTVEGYYSSGWMFGYNDDDFDNWGMDYVTLKNDDTLNMSYSLDGADVCAAYAGLPTLKTLTIEDKKMSFETITEWDASYNASYIYKMDDAVLEGDGSAESPFVVNIKLPYTADLSAVNVNYELYANENYGKLQGLTGTMDLSKPVTCSVTSLGGRSGNYKLVAIREAAPTATPTATPTTAPTKAPTTAPTTVPSVSKKYTKITHVGGFNDGDKILMIYDGDTPANITSPGKVFMIPSVVEKSNSSGTRKGFDIKKYSGNLPDTFTSADYNAYEWTIKKSGSKWKLGKDNKYIKFTETSSNKIEATLETNGDDLTLAGTKDAFTFTTGSVDLNYNTRELVNGYAGDPAKFSLYRVDDGKAVPTVAPTAVPTATPTPRPTKTPKPSATPAADATTAPVAVPTEAPKPTVAPTTAPVVPTVAPTTGDTAKPVIKVVGKKTVKAGKTIKLKAKLTNLKGKVKWSVNKKKLATISKAGKLKAKKKGTVTVTAKIGKVKGKLKIKIK